MARLQNQKLLQTVLADYQASKRWRQGGWDQKAEEFYSLYRSQQEERGESTRHLSNLNIPYTFQVIETVVPRLVGARPEIKAQPREESDAEKAQYVGEMFSYAWELERLNDELEKVVRDALMYGTGFARCSWDKELGLPTFISVDPADAYPDITATCDRDLQYFIHEYDMTADDLISTGKYDDVVIKKLKAIESKKINERLVNSQRAMSASLANTDTAVTDTNTKINIKEWWTKDRVVAVAEGEKIIRDEENPWGFIPFVSMRDYLVPHEYYGIGEVEHIRSLQHEANSLRNQIMDNLKSIVHRMWKRRRAGGVNKNTLVTKAGGVIDVNDINDIVPLDTQAIPSQAFEMDQIIKNNIQATTSVTDFQIGTSTDSLNDTATGVTLIQEAGNQRFRMKIRHLEDFINDIGNKMLYGLQKWMPAKKVVRIIGQDAAPVFKTISRADIQGRFDIVIEAGSTQPVDRITERRNLVDILNLSQTPVIEPYVNIPELYKRVLIKYNIKDPENILKQPQEASGVEQMMTQMSPEEIDAQLAQMDPKEAQMIRDEMGRLLQDQQPESMSQPAQAAPGGQVAR